MRTIKPPKETAMVTGEGGFGLDVRPYDRKSRASSQKIRTKKLGFKDLANLVERLVLDQ